MARDKAPRPAKHDPVADKDFARLYHHIPADGLPTAVGQGAPRTHRWRKILLRSFLVICIVAFAAGGFLAWKAASNSVRIFGWRGTASLFATGPLKGEKEGRVNLLLAGNSTDDPGHGGAALTDSIMVVSIDTVHHSGFLLSIPRDLYVNIPDHGRAKINEAYQDGEHDNFKEAGYANGGMGLLEKVVTETTGLPIHYYALVDYAALEQAVDAVDGITLTINSSDPRGLYDPSKDRATGQPLVKLPNGTVTLNGHQALNLARARGHARGSYGFGLSDFARTEHQRQILIALKDKAATNKTLANPLKLSELFDALGKNVSTDLTLGQANRLYGLVKKVPSSKLTSANINGPGPKDFLKDYTNSKGQATLIPRLGRDDYSEIQEYIQSLQTPPPTDAS